MTATSGLECSPSKQSIGSPGCFIVGFFDLVGIGSKLCKLPECPKVGQEAVDELGALAVKVTQFRDDFEKFAEGELRISTELDKTRGDAEKEWCQRHDGNPVKAFAFADTVIAYSSLDPREKYLPLASCLNILMRAATSQFFSLVRRTPVRGGIEIGFGTEIGDREIFGSAAYWAYHLEHKVADWPRILVGKQLRKYISDVAVGHCNSDSDRMNKNAAGLCLELLCFDQDDNAMLDLLSPFLAFLIGDEYERYLAKARGFVAFELDRFVKADDSVLARRYKAFSRYLNADHESACTE